MKLRHKNLQDGYKIVCTLSKGKYQYSLYFDNVLIYSFKDKYIPEDLPKLGKINRLINKITNVKNIGTKEDIRKLKNDIYEDIVGNLQISLDEYECIFNGFHQTNGCVYNHNDTVIFYFMVKNVKKYQDDIYEISIIDENSVNTYKDTVDNILLELVDLNLVMINYNNYGFIFKSLVKYFLLNGD